MDRYQNEPPSFELRSSQPTHQTPTDRPIYHRKQLKVHKYTQPHTLHTLDSIDNQPIDTKIPFKLQRKQIAKDMPGVGQYDISIPIVKPAYQTYQKNNDVVLVKINHIGGTSSFRSEQHRFNQHGQSIYIPSLTPGPGAYNSIIKRKSKYKYNKPYSQSYDIIHDLIMQNRQTIQSIPNYSLPAKADLKYNGMPRHLQDMYHKLDRARMLANSYRDTSLQLKDLLRIKQQREQVPMRSVEQPQTFVYLDIEKQKAKTIPYITNQKMTQTMCRFEQQKKKQTQRARKIQAILNVQKKRSFSVQRNNLCQYKNSGSNESRAVRYKCNQNMVNMLFGQNSKRQQSRAINNSKRQQSRAINKEKYVL